MFFFLYFTLLSAKRYKNDANIPVYGSKVSPFKNPFETYDFLDSVYNIEAELDSRVADALEEKRQADQQNTEEETQGLTLTPEF